MSELTVFNTLTRKLEKFEPVNPDRVRMYVCGPTVYGDSHLGHAKSYISFDLVYRWLKVSGYNPLYVQNITDVGHLVGDAEEGEDKIQKLSKETASEPMAIAEGFTRSYFEDMDRLNILRPHISPRATGHIPEQIEMIQSLIAKGIAYESNGSVYFDVKKFPGYGKLSGRKTDELLEGVRVEIHEDKKNPLDFALWKKAEPNHLMRWNSPWGVGFPGWHIECSAMSMKYLGESFDIHGGGLENQFPHHECEIAQSEAATGKPFVKYWLHNNMVTVNGEKMGKSKGNFILVKDLIKTYDPMVIRFLVLSSHYRSPIDFSAEGLTSSQNGYERLMNVVAPILKFETAGRSELTVPAIRNWFMEFSEAMNDDFNSPRALAVLFNVVKALNTNPEYLVDPAVREELPVFFKLTAGEVLGLLPETGSGKSFEKELETAMNLILELRAGFRLEKNWAKSDLIRERLSAGGLLIEDGKEGSRWKIKTTS